MAKTIAAGRSILRSAALVVVCRYWYTMRVYTAFYGLAMWSDMHGQNKAAPNCSEAACFSTLYARNQHQKQFLCNRRLSLRRFPLP